MKIIDNALFWCIRKLDSNDFVDLPDSTVTSFKWELYKILVRWYTKDDIAKVIPSLDKTKHYRVAKLSHDVVRKKWFLIKRILNK